MAVSKERSVREKGLSVVAIVFDAMGPTNLLPFFPKNSPARIWHGWPLGIVSRAATLIADLPNLIAESAEP